MVRRAFGAAALLVCLFVSCSLLPAQTGKTITIRILDGKSGELVTPSNFMVRINHLKAVHMDWVRQNDDGTTVLTIPADATVVSIRATYDNSMEYYVNCDAAGEKNTFDEHWYAVSEVLTDGIVTPNDCVKPKVAERIKTTAKPGEFVFYVRQLKWHERQQEY